jgi:hypothetical protein
MSGFIDCIAELFVQAVDSIVSLPHRLTSTGMFGHEVDTILAEPGALPRQRQERDATRIRAQFVLLILQQCRWSS